jgi:hypothetical protein
MYELSRVRLYSIGPAGARYADTVLDLRGVGDVVPDPAPTQAEFFEEEPIGPRPPACSSWRTAAARPSCSS